MLLKYCIQRLQICFQFFVSFRQIDGLGLNLTTDVLQGKLLTYLSLSFVIHKMGIIKPLLEVLE